MGSVDSKTCKIFRKYFIIKFRFCIYVYVHICIIYNAYDLYIKYVFKMVQFDKGLICKQWPVIGPKGALICLTSKALAHQTGGGGERGWPP